MFRKYILRSTFISIALIFILACGFPTGLVPRSQPASSFGTNVSSVTITETAVVASAQAAWVATNAPLLSPAEPTTPASTAPPSPQISSEGTLLAKQGDGSYLFIDYSGGYMVIIPPGWLVVRINQQEYANAWTLPVASDPKVQSFLTKFQKENASYYRALGVDIIPEDIKVEYLPYFSIEWDRNTSNTLQQEVDQLKEFVPKSLAGYKLTYADMGTTSAQIPLGIVESNWQMVAASGQIKTMYQKQIVFKLKTGALIFVLSADQSLKDNLFLSFDLMTDRIKMLP